MISESTTLNDDVIKAISLDDNVMFYWELLPGMWEVDECDALFKMIIELWVTIRGFAYASGWLEHYKQIIKTSLQKSKGVRKTNQIIFSYATDKAVCSYFNKL